MEVEEPPRASVLLDALESALSPTHSVGLPDNASAALFRLLERRARTRLVPVTREGEAFAVAAGLWTADAAFGMRGRLTKEELLAPLARLRGDAVVVTSMGVVRPWARFSTSPLDFASADSAMGHTADFALGLALARPERRVVCLNGDGSMLMTLGTLVTIAAAAPANLVLFVVENGTYELTGNQPIPGATRVDFAGLARAAGIPSVHAFDDAAAYAQALPGILASAGPVVVVVEVEPGAEGPLERGAPDDAPYLRVSLAESTRRLRATLAGPP